MKRGVVIANRVVAVMVPWSAAFCVAWSNSAQDRMPVAREWFAVMLATVPFVWAMIATFPGFRDSGVWR